MKIFDGHLHTFPDAIAAPTLQKLSEVSGLTPSFDGTHSGALAYLKREHLTAGLNCPIATRPQQVPSILRSVATFRWPLISLGTIHPDSPDKRAILQEIKALKLPGIKMHPEYQEFAVEEDRVQEIWQICQELDLPILFHAGEDVAFPPPCKCPPSSLKWLSDTYPGLKIIAAHFGGWKMWEQLSPLIGSSVYLDLSLVFEDWDCQRVPSLIRQHGSDKILFASDSPWGRASVNVDVLKNLGFSQTELADICWNNAKKLFHFELFTNDLES